MTAYLLRRVLGLVPVLIGVTLLIFFLTRVIPGDPATAMLGQRAAPNLVQRLRTDLGLDRPLFVQYLDFLGSALQGDFGTSTRYRQPALDLFLERDLRPAWLTLNLSCPNTEDDPGGHQTEARTRDLCRAVIERLGAIPLWVKLGPTLADEQYRVLLRVFHETGVRAIVATNTLPEPSPPAPDVLAGIGGGRLHTRALEVAALLLDDRARHGYTVDVIGGGGVLDGATLDDFRRLGIPALQYWSALIYRGPLAAAVIEHEAEGTFYDQHTK